MSASLNRRMVLKWAAAAPLFGAIAADALWRKAQAAVSKAAGANIYANIGVRPFINARGTWTYLSGSLELPEVRAALRRSARIDHFRSPKVTHTKNTICHWAKDLASDIIHAEGVRFAVS